MKVKNFIRVGVAAVGAAAITFGMQGSAWAAQTITLPGAGYGQWQADPDGSIPGDSIRACDNVADGYGIEVHLDIHQDGDVDRVATTAGYSSPFCTAWKSGNIPEGTKVRIWVYKVKGGQIHGEFVYMNSTA
ncbi:hypothetical protein [Streptomyces sp. NPDC055186]